MNAPTDYIEDELYGQRFNQSYRFDPDEPLGIPSESPARWIALGIAMTIQENGTESLDYFAMLRGWDLSVNS